ncbi:MAG: ATP-binding cassette domain-containing protein [Nitriliruptoraceae bacterium]
MSEHAPVSPDVAVEVSGVHHTFAGDVHALTGVDLTVRPGTIYGLLGPNGAGKTTLIRVLATLLRPDRGSVRVSGIDVLADPVAARFRIGLAGQFAAVDAFLTGRENVRMIGRLYGLSASEARRRTDEVLEGIGLGPDANRRVRTYSGGMQRRLDLAASLVGRPEVLFLDEPTTGVDPRNRAGLWELIERLVGDGTTVLLTTQYLEEADRLADLIGLIDHGHIVREGRADELKEGLGTTILRVVVDASQVSSATEALATLDGAPRALVDGDVLRIPAASGTDTLLDAVRVLDRVGVAIRDVSLITPTLDDVFLQLTGQPPTPAAGVDASADAAR